ncbi:PucR family transcriptional regulator [Nocardia sp. BMG51109]|uniref:PucR family transcriptional regulator n=1 Tax=Nocardia sp. BMG51109 TaxID=1056816 RepID=UPI00046694A1|nr:PucR family transcriptional regulator [Nocardia sp. BMG51109]
MTLTVAEIVALPVIQRGEPAILSARGFDTRVRWVHVSDVADLSGLLQGGELVLTTGSALRTDPHRYLSAIAAAHAVGVIVELGPAGPLPTVVGDIADELGLAMVALPRVIRFVEVTEQVHRAIVNDQYEEVAFARRVHEVFTDLGMRRGSPADIVDATAQLLDAPIVLEDLSHQAVAVAAAGHLTAELLHDWGRRSRLHAADADRPETREWVDTPVGRGGESWGRLIALRAAASPRTTMVLERAAQALAMHRMAERGRFDIEHQAQAGLLDDVLRERIRTEEDATARAFALGLRAAPEYLPAAVRVGGWPQDGDPVTAHRHNTRLLDTIVRAVRASGHTGLFSLRSPGEVGMVLSLRTGRGRSQHHVLTALGDSLRRDTERATGAGDLVLGVAAPASGLVEAIQQIADAAHVAEVALAMPTRERSYFRVADIRLRGLVTLLRTDPRVQRFAETELRALILHDLETGDRYLDVLRGYLESAGNKSALAHRLHMSRPALYTKLDRIETLLGVDLTDGESMTSLHVALMILDAQPAPAPAGS